METRSCILNLRPGVSIPTVSVSQRDVGVPLNFIIYDGTYPASFESGTTATLQTTRPSGTGVSEACTISGNIVSISTTLSMTREGGELDAEIRFVKSGTNVGTANFTLYVEPSAYQDDAIDADTTALQEIAQDIRADVAQSSQNAAIASQAAGDAQGYANTASTNADVAVAAATTAVAAKDTAVAAASSVSADASVASDAASMAQTASAQAVAAKTDAQSSASSATASATTATNAKNDAITAKNAAETAKDQAVTAKNDAVSAKNDAVGAKTAAETAASNAEDYSEDSEAYAIGTRGGVAVTSGDPAYHNNSKYWASQSGENLASDFFTSTAYAVGDYVRYNGSIYRFTSAHAAGAWNASHVTQVTAMEEVADLKDDLNNFSDNRVITEYAQKTYADILIALTGRVVSEYIWNKITGVQDTNSNGKYARFDNIGQYETLYISGADIDADHRLYAFYTANGTLISAKAGTGASGSGQVRVSVPENADYVIINTMYSTGDTGRNIDIACSALKVGEQDIVDSMLIAQGTVTEGYAWRPGETPLQNSSCRYVRYNTVPSSEYIYVTGRAYRVSAPLISFYNNSDELISSYGANSLTYYERTEMAVPAGTSYFIVNGTENTPFVYYPASSSKKTQREVNEDVRTDLTDIRDILDNIDPLSSNIKEALLNCFKYVYWVDDKGHDAYEELKEALLGIEYIYKLEEPLVVDGTTGYLVTDVAPFTEDRSFTMFIDYTEGGRDWTVSSLVVDTIFQVTDVATNKNVIASTYKTANVSNVTTRISVFGVQYVIKQAKESAGNRRIKYGISYDAVSGKYIAVISVNETVIAPSEDHTDSEVSFVETDAVLNIGCTAGLNGILKGTINDLQILSHTTSQADLTAYVTGQN